MRQIMRFISTRCQSELLSPSKSKSRAGSCIAEVYLFMEFVELFAAFCDRDLFFGHVAKDHDR